MEKKLKDWITQRIHLQDVFSKKLKEIKEEEDSELRIEYKDKTTKVHIMPFLKIPKKKSKGPSQIITLNTKENLDSLIENWKDFSEIDNLKLIFVNPRIKENNFWTINPKLHNIITEKKALKKGLNTLFKSVKRV